MKVGVITQCHSLSCALWVGISDDIGSELYLGCLGCYMIGKWLNVHRFFYYMNRLYTIICEQHLNMCSNVFSPLRWTFCWQTQFAKKLESLWVAQKRLCLHCSCPGFEYSGPILHVVHIRSHHVSSLKAKPRKKHNKLWLKWENAFYECWNAHC